MIGTQRLSRFEGFSQAKFPTIPWKSEKTPEEFLFILFILFLGSRTEKTDSLGQKESPGASSLWKYHISFCVRHLRGWGLWAS